MELKGELTESLELIDPNQEQPNHYHAEAGSLGTMTLRKWAVVDFSLVPDEYKLPDAVKIGRVVRAGIASIPGIKIWEEITLRVDTKKGEVHESESDN